ncbi:LOW QUALITY PROTEIN: adenylate-forming reductase 06235-like [Vigna umbellata]|uniref:LOW QUALITY PROTEIN: adenylate-forming reductase 06235-like n=1 Tax=Vigna umbellata TaxID=87088 RepID=UPI001F5EB039|nr:LOW QUALITY PROTEIN: adenylate-forming reductase 06235-like [Vigna umbellata]
MENTEIKIARFSSCRGVAFEINPDRINPFAIVSPTKQEQIRTWLWLPWTRTNSFKVLPQPQTISPTRSRGSSHFCDIDIDASDVEVEFIAELQDIEKSDKTNGAKVQKLLSRTDPPKRSRLSIILLDQGFTFYKGLFMVCMALNLVALALSAAGYFPYAKTRATLFSIGNILALTLCRSEAVLRVVFWLAVKIIGRPCVSLGIKTATTSFLQSVGGIHSGCGVSSMAWIVYSLVLTLKNKEKTSPEIIGVAFTVFSLILLSSLVWLFILLSKSYEPSSQTYDLTMSKVVKKQEFWFTLVITILIIIPWLSVRKVQVCVSAPSSHASIIRFEGGVKAGLLGRVSPSPLSEWHAFGIISDGKKEHMMLAGAVGDFTKSLVSNPPKHLWVRTMHFAGLPYLVNLYQRVLLVPQGQGFVCSYHFFCSLITELVNKYPKEKVMVHDTALSGRPNVAEMSVDAAVRWNVEVVIVTSNPEGSRDVLRACKRANIPAFGPIWDS